MMDATGTGLEERVAELTRQISGSVLGRTDADYDTVRAVLVPAVTCPGQRSQSGTRSEGS